jgi:homoserine O-acetyltransferase
LAFQEIAYCVNKSFIEELRRPELLQKMHFENVVLQGGTMLPYVNLVYKTYGKLNSAGDNCILVPTSFSVNHVAFAQMIGRARALNPAKYFIVIPNLLGNGISTSPSNMQPPFHGSGFPNVTIADNVGLQYRLLTEKLRVRQIKLVYGYSIAAVQACAWAAIYPDMVQRLMAVCGLAKCPPLNVVVLRAAIAALTADCNFRSGNYTLAPEAGLRALARLLTGWAYSATFFREHLYRNLGFESAESLSVFNEKLHLARDANDVLTVIRTYMHSVDEPVELHNITAKTIYMPCDHDLRIPIEEARIEAAQIPHAELRPIFSPYGHNAGAPGRVSPATIFIEQTIRELLAA